MSLFDGHKVLGFDTETTGLNPRKDRIVQYAFIGREVDGSSVCQTELIDPGIRIPEESTRVHGISNEDVIGCGSFGEHAQDIAELIDGAIIIGHNVNGFDWRFIEFEFMRIGESLPTPYALVDTLELARALKIPGRHTLGHLCKRYGIGLDRAHSADADAAAALVLLWKMVEGNQSILEGGLRGIQELCGRKRRPFAKNKQVKEGVFPGNTDESVIFDDGECVIAFGKYSGKSFSFIDSCDPRYAKWLMSESSPIGKSARDRIAEYRIKQE